RCSQGRPRAHHIGLLYAGHARPKPSALPRRQHQRHHSGMSTALTQSEQKPAKEPRISKRLQQAVTLIGSKGITQREAANRVGMSEWHLSRELKKPHVRVFMERAARQSIALGVLRASNRVMELVDAGSEHVSLDASKHVLGIAGIKPASDAQ